MTRSRSPFRFVPSPKAGHYSVWRGEELIGYVSREIYQIHGGTIPSGWRAEPIDVGDGALSLTLRRTGLRRQTTREAAARALWFDYQRHKR